MRLRHIVFASHDLGRLTGIFNAVFDIKVAYHDRNNEKHGLRNAVMPAGRSFLEVVEPIMPNTSTGRFLDRAGGDAGYMIDLQVADSERARSRAVDLGARVIYSVDRIAAAIDPGDYICFQFHPADFGGVLVALDQQRNEPDHLTDFGDWTPAGNDWRKARASQIADVVSLTLAAPQPDAMAQRWSQLLGLPLDPADGRHLPLNMGAIRFAQSAPDARPTMSGLTVRVANADTVLRAAAQAGVLQDDGSVFIGGARFDLISD